MPGGDGTGPLGFGPMTGWGRCFCRSFASFRYGWGRYRAWGSNPNVTEGDVPGANRKYFLRNQAQLLEQRLQEINKELQQDDEG